MLTPSQIEQAKRSPLDLLEVISTQQGNWYQRAPHLEVVNDALMRAARREIKRLMIFMPPQHGKSTLVSRGLPSWWVGSFPDEDIMLTSYGQDWADHWGRETRDTIEEFGSSVFGVTVADDSAARGRWQVEGRRGGFKAAGIAGSVTGRPADLLIIDDPVKNQDEAFSATIHNRNIQWWASTASTRLHKDSVVVLMMTRWHPNDLAGFLLGEEGWTVVTLPAIAGADDMMGREPGEPLFPERYPLTVLEEIRARQVRVLDGYFWNAMYQQQPHLPEGLLYFDKATCEYGRDHAPDPRERIQTAPLPGQPANGYVMVWERPQPGERYYIGADTADGKGETLGTWSASGGPDRNAAAIYKASNDTQVAEIYGRQPEHEYAKLLYDWGVAYNNALLAVERNRRAVLVNLLSLRYPNLYWTPRTGDMHAIPALNPARQIEYGFDTTSKSRPQLLADHRTDITTGVMKPQSREYWDETLTFVHGDPPAATPGQHDDRVMAHAIAGQARRAMRAGRGGGAERSRLTVQPMSMR